MVTISSNLLKNIHLTEQEFRCQENLVWHGKKDGKHGCFSIPMIYWMSGAFPSHPLRRRRIPYRLKKPANPEMTWSSSVVLPRLAIFLGLEKWKRIALEYLGLGKHLNL
ncbi:MAG: hypothetical protein IPM82_02825 [Saprospiraceae bacterium]|nr:hypothetical protein [Saprospiraceae bacterium]